MARWKVIDPQDGGDVFTVDDIHNDLSVIGGLFTPRAFAKKLARDNSDPLADAPLQAVKADD